MMSNLVIAFLLSMNFLFCFGEDNNPRSMSNICNCHCNQPKPSLPNPAKENKTCTTDESFDFQFTNKGTSDYVMTHDLSRDLRSFTISLWMRSYDRTTSGDAALFSYATPSGTDNTILLISTEKLRFGVERYEKVTSIKLNDGKWHHVAFTWQNSDGAWKGYKDGIEVSSGSGFQKGKVLSKTGTIVLGQEQDSVGGQFLGTQCYIGLLTQVNLWDRVLSPQEIKSLSTSCHSGTNGNILKWDEHWLAGVRGNARVLRPSSCKA